jgi:hypothetical protein
LPLSALTLALACITRWLYLALIIPWGLSLLITWKGHIRWRESLIALLSVLVMFLPQIAYSRTNPNPTLDHAWVEGWSPLNAFRQVFDNIDGHFEYALPNGIYYAQPFYDSNYLAPVFTPLLLVGLAALFRQKRYTALVMLLGWVLLPYLFLAGIPYQNIRFPLIVFPAVAILAGVGLESLIIWVRHMPTAPRRYTYYVMLVLVILGSVSMLRASTRTVRVFIYNQQRDKETAVWAAEQIPAGATVYTFGLTLTLQHYTALNVRELYDETPESLEQEWVPGQECYLLVNVWNLKNQWEGRAPMQNYDWLRDARGLVRLGKYANYTLYGVNG